MGSVGSASWRGAPGQVHHQPAGSQDTSEGGGVRKVPHLDRDAWECGRPLPVQDHRRHPIGEEAPRQGAADESGTAPENPRVIHAAAPPGVLDTSSSYSPCPPATKWAV